MLQRFVILAHVPTESVTRGFIPAIRKRGIPLLVVTDQPERHRAMVHEGLLQAEEILAADVFNPLAVLNTLAEQGISPLTVLSNSDHLQSACALVADFFQLPNKAWQACLRTKNKLLMRQTIAAAKLDSPWYRCVTHLEALDEVPMPCVVKPVEGVASEHVSLVHSQRELTQTCRRFWQSHPGQALLLEEYLAGPLHTLETLGDGEQLEVLGSFETFLSPPPAFIELGQRFNRRAAPEIEAVLLAQLRALGVGFGSCHTEFVLTQEGPRLIEVNYRNIGDQSDFLLAQALDFDLFDALIGLYLGESLPALPKQALSARIHCLTAEHSGTVAQVPSPCQFEREGCQIEFSPLCQQGERIEQQHSNRDYLGIIRGTGPSDTRLERVLNDLADELAITIEPTPNAQDAA